MNKILEVENLVFKYEKESDVNQLNGVSFSITKGEWVSIIGQNGSGKSTTARLIDGLFEEFEGKVNGTLCWPPKGEKGFGYDPMFVPNGYQLSFAELPAEEKNKISHRARALKLFTDHCL